MTAIPPDASGPVEPANRMTLIPEFSSRSSNIEGEHAYRLTGIEHMLTPVLIILLDMVDSNIAATIKTATTSANFGFF